jgi:hypothetical protein
MKMSQYLTEAQAAEWQVVESEIGTVVKAGAKAGKLNEPLELVFLAMSLYRTGQVAGSKARFLLAEALRQGALSELPKLIKRPRRAMGKAFMEFYGWFNRVRDLMNGLPDIGQLPSMPVKAHTDPDGHVCWRMAG